MIGLQPFPLEAPFLKVARRTDMAEHAASSALARYVRMTPSLSRSTTVLLRPAVRPDSLYLNDMFILQLHYNYT